MNYNEKTDNYLRNEKRFLDNPTIQLVQADTESVEQLMRAYPNYELDTKQVVRTVRLGLGDKV